MALAIWAMTMRSGCTPSASPRSLLPYSAWREVASSGVRPSSEFVLSSSSTWRCVRAWAGRLMGLLDCPETWPSWGTLAFFLAIGAVGGTFFPS